MNAVRRVIARVDLFIVALLGAVLLATLLPARGTTADVLDYAVVIAVGWLFFLYGVRLPTQEAVNALRDWRLHGSVLAVTFVVFPLLGLLTQLLPGTIIPSDLADGLLFMCLLPSTVQSSIAFTSIARGNVAGSVVAASFSNLAGIVITPLLVALLLGGTVGFSTDSIGKIGLQLLAPFIAGQLVRRWLAPWVLRHKRLTTFTDRGSVILVVYSAFSQGVVDGIWSTVSVGSIIAVGVVCVVVLAAVLGITTSLGHRLGFSRADRVVLLMCGSKKSLASGIPMATVLLPAASIGVMVLPLMIFHQIQLIVCAVIARRMGDAAEPELAAQPS
ncbi:bile acid:sodium symporter family protein [Sanguibacter suarezii]|uniref:bile acid:sodium symporter family protein n=1 Tax=Sanguibacter suarezii TaxID=60921 RepID=UPI00082D715E|nr:bile acid:sodium symporter family protein [Sanguibacter suarezii]